MHSVTLTVSLSKQSECFSELLRFFWFPCGLDHQIHFAGSTLTLFFFFFFLSLNTKHTNSGECKVYDSLQKDKATDYDDFNTQEKEGKDPKDYQQGEICYRGRHIMMVSVFCT